MGQLASGLREGPGSMLKPRGSSTGACGEYEYGTGRDHGW